jgi:methylenetetrahydrofolate dehydrogenase (NADP+) / methenyltetrahydrofolate cyclohydrolase
MEIKEYVAKRKEEIRLSLEKADKIPSLCIIQIGDNPASDAYIRGKLKDAAEVGVKAELLHLDESTTQEALLAKIKEKNADPSVTALLVQLPVPKAISGEAINATIDPKKDVDGFVLGSAYECCTPKGIIDYLTEEGFPFRGANAVVVGRSQIVGKPMAKMLLKRDCNVTVLHSKTKPEDMRFYLRHADLVVVAIGKEAYFDRSYEFKPSAWVVDVGINRGADGHLHGDCVPNLPVAHQTPVPGGVGLLTRLALLDNLLEAMKQ